MTAEQALAFLVFATVAAVTPGPSNMLLTAVGAARGVLRGLLHDRLSAAAAGVDRARLSCDPGQTGSLGPF